MNEDIENLILEHLPTLRAGQERLEFELREVKARLTSLEAAVAGGRRDTVLQQEDIYRQQASIDRLTERVARIERRLELREVERSGCSARYTSDTRADLASVWGNEPQHSAGGCYLRLLGIPQIEAPIDVSQLFLEAV